MIKMLRKLLPDYAFRGLIILVIVQLFVYSGTQLFPSPFPCRNWECGLDGMIPLIPWTIVIYCASFPFWAAGCILSVRFDRDRACRFLAADLLSKAVSLLLFVLLPTTNTRPELTGTDFWTNCVRLIYAIDPPRNLFPSFHCLLSWLCVLGICAEPKIPKAWKAFSCLFTVLIFLSTLTMKQHVIVDVIGGWALADFCYRLCGKTKLPQLYEKVFLK